MTILCRLGFHRARVIDLTLHAIREGCDRCGKVRTTFRSDHGRIIEVSPWT